ncbi:MAG: deoxyribonuclease IV [Thermoleophilia bacterium]|nr:deoxyribonuclease IV [Thermoleophilia bacterium]
MKGPRAARTGRGRSGRAKLPLIGAQVSTAGGFTAAPERARTIGAEVVQFFSSNPRTWRTRTPDREEIALLTASLRRHSLPLYLHTIYLINLASPDEHMCRRSASALAHALATGALTEAAGVVTHVGSHKGEGFEKAAARIAGAIRTAFEEAGERLADLGHDKGLPALLLENSAGSGNTVGARLEELAALLASFPLGPRIGMCLDTAHLFAAGYPVHEEAGLEKVMSELRDRSLLERVWLIHLNDSASPFASNRDLHENPGDGLLGYEGLSRVVRHPALAHIPFVLEVPGADGRGPDAANVAVVKSMREGAVDLPRGPAHDEGHRVGSASPDPAGRPPRCGRRPAPPA